MNEQNGFIQYELPGKSGMCGKQYNVAQIIRNGIHAIIHKIRQTIQCCTNN